jgi:hypothetical protein
MGATVVSSTVQSGQVGNDDDVDVKAAHGGGAASVAFNSMGTTPVLRAVEAGPGRIRVRITSGSGSPAIAANNVVVTLVGGRTPRKVFIASSVAAPGFHIASVGAGTVSLGTKVAPAASTQYDIDLIVLF